MMVFPTRMSRMTLRAALVLLLLATALVAEAAAAEDALVSEAVWGFERWGGDSSPAAGRECSGTLGECVDEEEEMGLDSEVSRRQLQARGGGRFISYGALNKNRVPCSRRGRSYYNCAGPGRANPYHRGCSVITRCARDLH